MSHSGIVRASTLLFSAVAAVLGVTPLAAAAAGAPTIHYSGSAYGTAADGPGVALDRTAPVGLPGQPCGTTGAGLLEEAAVAGAAAAPLFDVGLIETSAATADSGSVQSTTSTASVADVELLGMPGVVSVDAVTVVANAFFDGVFDTSADGTLFQGLVVLGLPVIDPAPGTEILLPGIGRLLLNEQTSRVGAERAAITVTGMRVVVDQPGDPLGIPTGTEIVVARARAEIKSSPLIGLLGGSAYATAATLSGTLVSDPTGYSGVPCQGGVATAAVAALDEQPLFSIGAAASKASGDSSPTFARARTQVTVGGVNVLDGLITADSVRAVSLTEKDAGGASFSSAGSAFLNLVVAGVPIPDGLAEGDLDIPTVGTLTMKRVTTGAQGQKVVMLALKITDPGVPGVPLGTTVLVGVAASSID